MASEDLLGSAIARYMMPPDRRMVHDNDGKYKGHFKEFEKFNTWLVWQAERRFAGRMPSPRDGFPPAVGLTSDFANQRMWSEDRLVRTRRDVAELEKELS